MCRLHRPLVKALRSVLVAETRLVTINTSLPLQISNCPGKWSEDERVHHDLSLFFLTLLSSRTLSLSLFLYGCRVVLVGCKGRVSVTEAYKDKPAKLLKPNSKTQKPKPNPKTQNPKPKTQPQNPKPQNPKPQNLKTSKPPRAIDGL